MSGSRFENRVCSICLSIGAEFFAFEKEFKYLLASVCTRMTLEMSDESYTCSECLKELVELNNFKLVWLAHEERIRQKVLIAGRKISMSELGLFPNVPIQCEITSICRLCFSLVDRDSSSNLLTRIDNINMSLGQLFEFALSDMVVDLTYNPIFCATCVINIQLLHAFIEKCLDTERKIKTYIQNTGTSLRTTSRIQLLWNVLRHFEHDKDNTKPKSSFFNYYCDLCDYKTFREMSFRSHRRLIHPVECVLGSPASATVTSGTYLAAYNVPGSQSSTSRAVENSSESSYTSGVAVDGSGPSSTVDDPGNGNAAVGPSATDVGNVSAPSVASDDVEDASEPSVASADLENGSGPSIVSDGAGNGNALDAAEMSSGLVCTGDAANASGLSVDVGKSGGLSITSDDGSGPSTTPADAVKGEESPASSSGEELPKTLEMKIILPAEEDAGQAMECTTSQGMTIIKRAVTSSADVGIKKIFTCDVCNIYQSEKRANLNRHKARHSLTKKPQSHRCIICNFEAKSRHELVNHNLSHYPPKEFRCQKCPYSTDKRRNLSTHLSRHKKREREEALKGPFVCSFCPFRTTALTELTEHNILAHTPKPPEGTC